MHSWENNFKRKISSPRAPLSKVKRLFFNSPLHHGGKGGRPTMHGEIGSNVISEKSLLLPFERQTSPLHPNQLLSHLLLPLSGCYSEQVTITDHNFLPNSDVDVSMLNWLSPYFKRGNIDTSTRTASGRRCRTSFCLFNFYTFSQEGKKLAKSREFCISDLI